VPLFDCRPTTQGLESLLALLVQFPVLPRDSRRRFDSLLHLRPRPSFPPPAAPGSRRPASRTLLQSMASRSMARYARHSVVHAIDICGPRRLPCNPARFCRGKGTGMPQTCRGHATDMPRTCGRHAADMRQTSHGHAAVTPRTWENRPADTESEPESPHVPILISRMKISAKSFPKSPVWHVRTLSRLRHHSAATYADRQWTCRDASRQWARPDPSRSLQMPPAAPGLSGVFWGYPGLSGVFLGFPASQTSQI
jgi:hypothetical protein